MSCGSVLTITQSDSQRKGARLPVTFTSFSGAIMLASATGEHRGESASNTQAREQLGVVIIITLVLLECGLLKFKATIHHCDMINYNPSWMFRADPQGQMPDSSRTNTATDRRIKKETGWISKCYQMVIVSDILLKGAPGIVVAVFECPDELSR